MLRVGENLNVMVKKIGTAMKDRDPKPIQELAIAEAKAGVDFIDINLGPARKGGGELMEWVVKTVQEVADTPLYLDTINAEAIEAGLKVYKKKKGKAVVNSIMARPESMDLKFPIAAKYNAGLVALLWGRIPAICGKAPWVSTQVAGPAHGSGLGLQPPAVARNPNRSRRSPTARISRTAWPEAAPPQ